MNEAKAQKDEKAVKGYVQSLKKSMTPRIRELRFSLFLMRKSLLAIVGIVLVLIIVVLAILAPILAPTPPNQRDPMDIPRDFQQPKPPGAEGHILGTGKLGTDIYYGVVWGSRTSIYIAVFVVLVSAILGIVLGAVSGYYGGAIDEALMRITDIFLSVPGLILAMAVAAVLSRSLENIMLALIVVWWPPYARIVRGQVLSVKESTYVEAARAVGAKKSRVLFRHVVPNSLAPMLVSMTMDLGVVVLVAAGLSYIGFGPPTGTAEWGKMVSDGQEYFLSTVYYNGVPYNPWWMVTFPGAMIFIFVLGFNLLGDGLRDILDPRLRR
ncbi:MAG: ABC transporter permease [Methanomassiliicoccales archaeon]|nr:ABC transporter permease [Methanomassiliicoccales archaeon]